MASTYTMVAYGSQGSAVKQLQSELNRRGYSLDEDGIFGKKTRAAVRDYQKKNGLRMVDGIAGDETWGSLLASPTAEEQAALDAAAAEAARPRAEVTESTARRLQELEKGYTPSDEVAAAREYRDSVAALEPEGYESGFSEKLQALYDQIAGRKAFEYDPEEDEDYQRYAKLYAARGAAAMEDTLGKAAALTGGYGSSYAQTAGQQAYNGYLQELAALDAAAAEAARPRAEVTESTARRLQELEKGYTPSDEVAAAREYRDSVAALEPEGYESGFSEKLQALYDQIAGRKAFEYDPEEDEDYQRYAKLYAARGAAAMEDTLGKAAALTGGYGSSYAQTAGQQAYNGYLQELAALVPELRQAALAEYRQEGQALETQYDLLTQQEKNEYQRWQDGRKEWEKLLAAAQDEYESAGDRDQKLYQALLNHFEDKAEQEKKLSSSGVRLVDSGEDGGRGESLSSTAAESLQRAVRNYLKKGNGDLAQALVEKYAQRMTPAQRQRFDALLSGGGQ